MQGWHLQGRHNHSGQGDPDVQSTAASACVPLVWIHKMNSGSWLRDVWATVQGEKAWTGRGQPSWTPMHAPTQFWTKLNGDARCANVLEVLRNNVLLVEAARPLIDKLFSTPSGHRKPQNHLQHDHGKETHLQTGAFGPAIDPERPIRVMHIPKTAGYSLRSELKKRFSLSIGHTEGE